MEGVRTGSDKSARALPYALQNYGPALPVPPQLASVGVRTARPHLNQSHCPCHPPPLTSSAGRPASTLCMLPHTSHLTPLLRNRMPLPPPFPPPAHLCVRTARRCSRSQSFTTPWISPDARKPPSLPLLLQSLVLPPADCSHARHCTSPSCPRRTVTGPGDRGNDIPGSLRAVKYAYKGDGGKSVREMRWFRKLVGYGLFPCVTRYCRCKRCNDFALRLRTVSLHLFIP